MATKLTADEVVHLQHVRGFLQFGEAGPENDLLYYGKSAQYFFVEGLTAPERGSISPVNMPDPSRRRAYRLVGRTEEPPDLPSYNLTLTEKHGKIPRALGRIGCEINLYLSVGRCKDPSDPDRGWEDYWHVLQGGIVSDKDHGARTSMTDDTPLQSSLTVTLADEYAVGALTFGAEATTNITAEAIDAVYGSIADCVDCGGETDRIYVLMGPDSGSPSAAPKVVYTTDGGDTWNDSAISGIGTSAQVAAIRQVGIYLVVLVPSEDAYYYVELNELTGAPGSTWTKVAAGIDPAGTPNDMYVASPVEVWLAGDGGYIYKINDITSGANVVNAGDATSENLLRITGDGDQVIVATGANGAIIKSEDNGDTWSTTTDNGGVADDITAIAVVTAKRYWFGTDAGEVWWTKNGGETWQQKQMDAALTAVHDITFPSIVCGFIAGTTSAPDAKLYTTINGGRTWNDKKARIKNLPVADRFNRIATPNATSTQTNVNNVVMVGLAGDGVDGIALKGAASEL